MKHAMKLWFFSSFLLLLVACTPPPQPVELKKTSIQLSWIHEYSVAPFLVAAKEGYFTQQGLDVTLLEGGFSEAGYIDPVAEVVNGEVDFGMTSGTGLITAVNAGTPVVAIANLLQRSPLALMTLDGSIQTLDDLAGHSILAADGGARSALEALLASQNIPLDSVTIVPRTDFGVDPLVNGEVDVLIAWRINEGVALEELDLNPTFFLLSDYGVENYEFVLFTRTELVETQPELVQSVVNALHYGRDFVIANPTTAIDHTLSFAPDLDRTQQLLRLESTIPLMESNTAVDIGMEPLVWEFSHQLMLSNGLIPQEFDITKVYTNQFAEASPELGE